jgi:hypothetical protein
LGEIKWEVDRVDIVDSVDKVDIVDRGLTN